MSTAPARSRPDAAVGPVTVAIARPIMVGGFQDIREIVALASAGCSSSRERSGRAQHGVDAKVIPGGMLSHAMPARR